jgi:glycine/D-amino acid oxidase-like deaminating enzyme
MEMPYWLDEPAPAIPLRTLDGPPHVAVVGAGVTGLSCALALARAGLRVRVHDARRVAEGASGRNGGFALRGTAAPYNVAVETVGREAAARIWRRTEEALDEMESLAGDAFSRTGSLRIANDEDEAAELGDELAALRADGLEAEWVDGSELRPPGRFVGAILHPSDAALQPARWVRRLAVAAAAAGAEIREGQRVLSLEELDAEHVVVATDGYPSGLLGELETLVIPTRGQMVATEPLAEALYDRPHYARHGFDYWQQTSDGRLLAGGFRDESLADELTTEERTTEKIQAALDTFVRELAGRDVEVTHRWAGLFGLVLDFLPVVGRVPGSERLWMAGGYSGHGNVLGFLCGELVAGALLDHAPPELALFDPARLL